MSKIKEKILVDIFFDRPSKKGYHFQNFCRNFMKFYTDTPNWLKFIVFKRQSDILNISKAIRSLKRYPFFFGQTVGIRFMNTFSLFCRLFTPSSPSSPLVAFNKTPSPSIELMATLNYPFSSLHSY